MNLLRRLPEPLKKLLRPLRQAFAPQPAVAAAVPADPYARRLAQELEVYADCEDVHDLPAIFHYWSNRYLGPLKFQPFGITDPEQFFFLYASRFHARFPGQPMRIVSIGSGNADGEVRLARRLLDSGVERFTIDCLDINAAMHARGRTAAVASGVAAHIRPLVADFNTWTAAPASYDVVIANHSLHHVVELEHLFTSIRAALNPEGYFLTADMIGRNGHQLWPEALALVQEFWRELPERYRQPDLEFVNRDWSEVGFEGIRAQDILPLLVREFHFELFIPFSNIVIPFVDRPFGHQFDVNAAWDRAFIDRVHARDEEGLMSGELKPTQMLAVLRTVPVETRLLHPRLTPPFCVRDPAAA